MKPMPMKIRKQLAADPEYTRCSLQGYHTCGGRITWEHAIIFASNRLNTRWAVIPVCAAGQEVDFFQDAHTMDKDMNKWVALNRATDDELRAVSKAINWIRERDRLNTIYGKYIPPPIPKPFAII